MSVETPVLQQGEAGRTELPNNIGYIEEFDVASDGKVAPVASTAISLTSSTSSSGPPNSASPMTGPPMTGNEKSNAPIDSAVEAVNKFEENWLDKEGDFTAKYIAGKSKPELENLKTAISTKKTELDRVISFSDRKMSLNNEFTKAKNAFEDAKKEINKLDKEIATYEKEIDDVKRDTKMDANTKNKKNNELRAKIDGVKSKITNSNIKQFEEAMNKAEYAKRNQDKAEATKTKLEELEKKIDEMLKAITEQKDNESKDRVFGAIKDLKDHPEQLRNFLIHNKSIIEKLPSSNEEILKLIDSINIALVGSDIYITNAKKTKFTIHEYKDGKYYLKTIINTPHISYNFEDLFKYNSANELLQLINKLQSNITLDNQPLNNSTPK
jgi:DNA repair exonuclease SbcCD ATPase subunit